MGSFAPANTSQNGRYSLFLTSVTSSPSNRQSVREANEASCCEWVTMMMVVPSRLSSCNSVMTS